MSKYFRCPNCGNMEEGYRVYRCNSCNGVYCGRCQGPSSHCPICGAYAEGQWISEIG